MKTFRSMKSTRSAASLSRSLLFVLAASILVAAQAPRVVADAPASLLPAFGNDGEKFTVSAKDGHAVHGWLPVGWVDNSVWAAVNATYSKLEDSPDKGAGAVRIKIDSVDEGHLQLTSFLGNREYKKGAKYVVAGWVRSPDHKIIIDDAPRGKVVGKQAPGTSGADHVEERIEDVSLVVARRSAEEFLRWKQGFYLFPF